ncbi:MAG: hypothetical protein ABR576_00370 [Thermoanaerobaculia bacterium]
MPLIGSGRRLRPRPPVRAHQTLGARHSLAIHFGTFAQADDGELEPIVELKAALDRRGEPKPGFHVLDNGQSVEIP